VLALVVALSAPASAGEPVWGKDMVQGSDFPLPFGASAVYFHQTQDYKIERLVIGIPGFPPIPTDSLKIKNDIDEYNAKLDAWLLPFLNVFAIGGKLDGKTNVDFGALQGQLGLPFSRIDIGYDGEVYGAGAVLAGGGDRWFSSFTTIATSTSLSGDFDSSASAFILTPRVGVYNRRGALYAGAMYQRATEKHKGTVAIPFLGAVPFEVKLKQKDDWNCVLGGTAAFGEHWTLQVEGGFGNRDHVDVELGYRF